MKLRNKKTGEIDDFLFESKYDFDVSAISDRIDLYRRVGTSETKNIWHYNSLAELNKEWEDYKPKEPLIKDEKIRKAVRAWAEVNSTDKALYAERPDKSLCFLMDIRENDYNIQFVGWIPTLKDSETYTIIELCGEEEE